jgi:hypothetical protein
MSKPPDKMSFAEHAEAWYTDQGNVVPECDTEAWLKMYEEWVEFAFKDL